MNAKLAAAFLGGFLAAGSLAPAQAVQPDSGYLAEAEAAMARMMAAMQIAPTGDVDRDFVAGMVPHHQGAVEMAQAELKFGKNVALQRIAQEIIVTQRDEIVAMHRALQP
jgi:uncharacterized protein (DUF305 family)